MSTENEEARRSRKVCFTSLDAAVVYVDREKEEARRSRKDCFTSLDAAVVYVDREKEEARRVVRVGRSYPRGTRKRRDGSIRCVRGG
jgi:hypothetical protein